MSIELMASDAVTDVRWEKTGLSFVRILVDGHVVTVSHGTDGKCRIYIPREVVNKDMLRITPQQKNDDSIYGEIPMPVEEWSE